MKLVLVETPSQAKTLTAILGEGCRVEPCHDVVRDLPTDKLGIDVNDDFRPTFTIATGKGNLVRRLMKALRECESVTVATPPNRDGEAMAWHVLALSPDTQDKSVYRVLLNALTTDGIRTAFATPRQLDIKQVEAHVTQRIVERLVGWSINAQAHKAVGFKTALTYHGMVALRLLIEREQHIAAFTPQTAWRASVAFELDGMRFTAQTLNTKGAPLTLRTAEQAAQLEALLKPAVFWSDKAGQITQAKPAPDALTLRTLVETAERDLHLLPERVLALVEMLYESGWITHPDGTPLADNSEGAKATIRRDYGSDYIASDAASGIGIAPTDVQHVPDDLPGDGAALYGLIWRWFVAAHMSPAQERLMAARILVGSSPAKLYPLELRVTARRLTFDGWLRVLPTATPDEKLPHLPEGTRLHPLAVAIEPLTSEPSAYFTPATLVSALVEIGLTVQEAVTTVVGLLHAEYARGEEALSLTDRGCALSEYLTDTFDDLTSPDFATELAADMDQIALGERERLDVLRSFWTRFGPALRPIAASHAVGEHKPVVLRPAKEA